MKKMLIGMVAMAALVVVFSTAQAEDRTETRYIQFEFDRSEILPAARTILHEVAESLQASSSHKLFLVGHTCDIGTDAYNEGLARRRADSALAYLLTVEGITREWILDSSKGEREPRVPNTDEENRSLNRRVELTLAVPARAAAPAPEPDRGVLSAVAAAPTQLAPSSDRAVLSAIAVAPERMTSSAGLLIDKSKSMCKADLHESVREFLSRVNPADRFVMASFDRATQDLGMVDGNQAVILTEREDPARESGTSLYNAIAEVSAGPLAARPAPRYLIIFSDGVEERALFNGNGSRKTLDQAVAAANAHGVKLITVELGPTTAEGRQALQELARRTGGKAMVWDRDAGAAQFRDIHRLVGTGD